MSGADCRTADPSRWLAWLLGSGAAILYLLTSQRQLYNDGVFFEHKLRVAGDQLIYNHILYLPLVKLVQVLVSVVHPVDPETAMHLVSALFGGLGVGLMFTVARTCLASLSQATACALLLAFLVGYWFHATATELHSVQAACAAIVLVSLMRALRPGGFGSLRSCLWLGVGTCLAPAAHITGACVALPALYVWTRVGPARLRFALSVVGGLVAFVLVYLVLMRRDAGFAGYTSNHTGKYNVLWDDPGRLVALWKAGFAEFSLYSTPASVLVVAGLRVLFRTQRSVAWLCLCWLFAWPLIAWPVGDRMMGAYYLPTYPVQALLAVVAMGALARSWWRAVLVALLALSPIAVVVWTVGVVADPEAVGLATLIGCGLVAFALAGPDEAPSPRGCFLLPVAALVFSSLHIRNVHDLDVVRDRIAAVARVVQGVEEGVGQPALVMFLAVDGGTNAHWENFYPGLSSGPDRGFNPVALAYLEPEQARAREVGFQDVLDRALAAGRPVFLAGSIEAVLRTAPRPEGLQGFLARVFAAATPAPTGLAGLVRLQPK